MLATATRIVLLLWAAFFLFLGVRGLIAPKVFTDTFGVLPGTGGNTLRADFAAFFIVASLGAALGAVRPAWNTMLIPAALFGTALTCRALGLALGDGLTPAIQQAMIVEGVSALLMIGAWRTLRPR